MAMAFGATVYDGVRCKIFTFTCLDGDAPADLVIAFDGAGGRPNALPAAPTEVSIVQLGGADNGLAMAMTAIAAGGVTIRKLDDPGAGAVACTFEVTCRIPRGIAG